MVVYINGLELDCYTIPTMTSEETVTQDDRYTIGYNWNGFLKHIIVENCCLTSDEVLSLYNDITARIEQSIAWFDFTGTRIEDKSKNKIPLKQGENSNIIISNICKVANFSEPGYIKGYSSISNIEGYSVLCKVYLNSNYDDNIYTLFSKHFEESKLKLSFRKSSTSSSVFQLSCSINNGTEEEEYISQATLDSREWIDVGISYSNSQLNIYINGTLDSTIEDVPFKISSSEGVVYAGASVDEKTISSDHFNGYISYICEFSKAIDASKFNEYKDNPPYLFSPSIASLFIFSNEITTELVKGKEYTFEQESELKWVIDTQSIAVSSLTNLDSIPEEYKAWEDYTDNQRWEMELCALILGDFMKSIGVVAEFKEDWYKESIVAAQLYSFTSTNSAFSSFLNTLPISTNDDVEELLEESDSIMTIISIAIQVGVVVGLCYLASKIYSSYSFALGSIAAFNATKKILDKVKDKVKDKAKDRPDKDDDKDEDDDKETFKIAMTSLTCIGDNAATSAIDVTKDGINSIKKGPYQDVACYVLQQITTPCISITVTCSKNTDSTLQLRLEGTETVGNIFGTLTSEFFTINTNEEKTIAIKFDPIKLKGNGTSVLHNLSSFYWKITGKGVNVFVRNTSITFYTVYSTPKKPWANDGKGRSLPWVDMLDMAAGWINKKSPLTLDEDILLERLTVGLNSSGAKLNLDSGLPLYISSSSELNDYLDFNLYYIAEFYKNAKISELLLSNMECALLLCTLSRLHGIQLDMATMMAQFCQGFSINEVQPMGYDKWMKMYPLPNNGDGFVSYQTFSVKPTTSAWNELIVYDASLKLKTLTPTALLPAKLELATPDSTLKAGSSDGTSYRGLLVKTGQITTVSMPAIDDWYISIKKQEEPENGIITFKK